MQPTKLEKPQLMQTPQKNKKKKHKKPQILQPLKVNKLLEIKEKQESAIRFEYFAITGKVYTIERSPDLATWERVPFALGAPGVGQVAQQAAAVGVVSAFAAPRPGPADFYRLTVR